MTTHTLSVLVQDHPGVLTRVASLFSRRGFNIESLAVGPTEKEGVSRMTLVTVVDDERFVEQLVKQLNKLVEVLKVLELPESSVCREMILVKVRCDNTNRSSVIDVVSLFRGKAVDVGLTSVTIEATGSHDKLEALLTMLEPYGVIELVKSGQVALGRGQKSINEKRARV
ncbi:acetolactate synthase small subunit [Propionimicrobium lymphophilum]|uniref:Acetolactate synthase small subunit n=1 Tax=Propionimicrobium lymphophilum ACS-093-V-SCH5 TaxID=883161 RepID=S2WKX3_9ACTN|nr:MULTISPECIES: acetolactate synthase small subunit [Propionimicrobium]EPD33297.1 acetolactate synthase, small subunit [Propionimicrobium lymphophilum ACS-093-V-SCH5]ETJ98256.1 acetolactate synthase, small subunit [Propionimicrobium sp. BV2F7]MDK7709679.1 acetolactate synthase small subunit [Propionimicrobium lymphophilum]MDK7734059.1 acetolactate synthase small subunit [Propionimicrobium lymphophilum]